MSDTINRNHAETRINLTKFQTRIPEQPVQPDADTIVLGRELGADPIGDMPWLRLVTELRARSRFAGRRTRRALRRWLHRQRTAQGHPAQIHRGTRRAASWVRGFDGNHIRALAHQAHVATKQSEKAAWQARFTVRGRDDAHKISAKAAEAAAQAVATHKKAKEARNKVRNLRAAAVLAPPTAAIAAGGIELGWAGMALGLLATATGLAVAGRGQREEAEFEIGWRSLGDGDPMTASFLDEKFRAAGVIGKDEQVRLIKPPMRDGDAWTSTFDLPAGITAAKAQQTIEKLAAAMGVEMAQVSITKAGRAGRVDLRVSDQLPFTSKPGRGPLLSLTGPTNLWGSVQIGPDVRGNRYAISLVERSGLIGGEPGAGKSASGNTILLAAALDPHVILCLADGKGGGDLSPFEPLADQFEGDADPEAMVGLLDDVIADMGERYALVKQIGARKVTEELAEQYPQLRMKLLWVDELMFYTTDEKHGRAITSRLRNIVSRGRAAGIITFACTQKPGSDVVDTSLRDLLSIRWALRCTTPQASDTILGQGFAANGFSAKAIEAAMRGAGLLYAEGSEPVMVRADYYDDDQVAALVKRAYGYRLAAGTLPAASQPTVLDALVMAAQATGRGNLTTAEAIRTLAATDPDTFGRRDDDTDASYAARTGKALKAALADLGAPLEPTKVIDGAGTRTNGYTLQTLIAARNAR